MMKTTTSLVIVLMFLSNSGLSVVCDVLCQSNPEKQLGLSITVQPMSSGHGHHHSTSSMRRETTNAIRALNCCSQHKCYVSTTASTQITPVAAVKDCVPSSNAPPAVVVANTDQLKSTLSARAPENSPPQSQSSSSLSSILRI